jgi:hypothetical protein
MGRGKRKREKKEDIHSDFGDWAFFKIKLP